MLDAGLRERHPEQLQALHSSRLELFVRQMIDTTVRGFLYETAGKSIPMPVLADGAAIARTVAEDNAIPVVLLRADPLHADSWLAEACAAMRSLLHAD